MKRLLFLVACFQGLFACAQDITLPIVKQGNWYLLSKGQEKPLPGSYSYVELFDRKGLAYFRQGKFYGVLDENGREVLPATYRDIKAFGQGFFSCQTDTSFELLTPYPPFHRTACLQVKSMNDHWVRVEDRSGERFLNLDSGFETEVDSTHEYEFVFDYLLIYDSTGQRNLFSPQGQLLFSGICTFYDEYAYALLLSDQQNFCFNAEKRFDFPEGAQDISVFYTHISYKLGKKAYLLSIQELEPVFSYPCDGIEAVKCGFEVRIGDQKGLVSASGKMLIPCRYDFFEYDDRYIYPCFNTLRGIYDYNFKELVPCNYKQFRISESFIQTTSANGFQGLISKKTFREILPAVYTLVEVKGKQVKARYNGTLSVFELNDQHEITGKYVLQNAVSLRSQSDKNFQREWMSYDQRLLALGWFLDEKRTDNLVWGLKNGQDSVLVKPKFKNLRYVPNAPFTLSVTKKEADPRSFLKAFARGGKVYEYKLLSHTTGRELPLKFILGIDTMDFIRHDFARFLDTASFGIIDAGNHIRRFSYMDMDAPGSEVPIRYCDSDHFKLCKTESPTSVRAFGYILAHDQGKYPYIEFTKAKWNFLAPSGDSLFREPFDFAQPFFQNSAIVQRNDLWGVISGDSLTIPLHYHSVKRLKEFGDTAFLVSVRQKGQLFLNSQLERADSIWGNFEQENGNFLVFAGKNSKRVYQRNGKMILETDKNIHFHRFNHFVVREKKNFLVYDRQGKVVGDVSSKPELFVREDAFVTENNGKKGILSVNGDTLVSVRFSLLECSEKFILAVSRTEQRLYSGNFSLLEETEEGRILADSISGNYALIKGSKVEVFDQQGKRISKFSSAEKELNYFFAGHFYSGKGKKAVFDYTGKEISFDFDLSGLDFLPGGFSALQNTSRNWLLYDEKLVAVKLPFQIRKIIAVEGGIFLFRTKSGLVIYNHASGIFSEDYKHADFNLDQGLLLAERKRGEFPYEFLTPDFQNPFAQSFRQATVFKHGFAAVSDERGWTVIDREGDKKSYPSYNPIEVLGPDLLLTSPKNCYGIIGASGKVLIEPVYESVNIVNRDIIRLIKDGEIHYRDFTGKVLY